MNEKLFDPEKDQIEKGTAITHVRNTLLAAGLIAMGIPLRDDPPFTHVKDKKGNEVFTYNFFPCTPDGRYHTMDLIVKWKKDLDFIAEEERKEEMDPDYVIHPWARVVTALKNYQELLEGQRINIPFIPFEYMSKQGPMVTLVQEGGKKYKAAMRRKEYKRL